MKVLNPLFKGATWSNGNFPKPIVFNDLTTEDIPFLEKNGFDFLIMVVCDVCQNKKCKCKKTKKDEDNQAESN